jgi:hypothetical protein
LAFYWWVTTRRGRFDWELASIFGTAVETLLLAVATGALALTTARDVSATQEIALLTRSEQDDVFAR